MIDGILADFSRTCEGCTHLYEDTVGKKRYYHCGAEGARKGYMIGVNRLVHYVPVWCPEMAEESQR